NQMARELVRQRRDLEHTNRLAAWAEMARQVAHEVKNPLTPIQLAAERLKRRFAREIVSDPETFRACADTIVRHVGDIRRMVDEFSSFARMPQPVMRTEDLAQIVREALVLPRAAHPQIAYVASLPREPISARADRRLLGQALTNLLQNATDAILMRAAPADGKALPAGPSVATQEAPAQATAEPAPPEPAAPQPERIGRVEIVLERRGEEAVLSVADDGIGLPEADRERLTEPYVTHKPKGTGLGLAIVKKIFEDHGAQLALADRPARADWPGGGALVTVTLRLAGAARAGTELATRPSTSQEAGVESENLVSVPNHGG
ncbi:MAG: hypothetical protein KGK10_09355, partial [Rhodospirillales bacterium]|nr:hypothetical protein [Rhodospirillales bacterium]